MSKEELELIQKCYENHRRGSFRDDSPITHIFDLLDEVERLQKEVKRLKEFEWKYKDLCK